jgi:addiction module RelE/StbE family toxin
MRIDYSNKFLKKFAKVPLPVRKAFQTRLDIFTTNSNHPLLRNHALTGKYEGYRSINVTGDWRAIFEECDDLLSPSKYFIDIGTHSQLYR